jgi:DNA repair exonuclease SbcCD ATPase subunit
MCNDLTQAILSLAHEIREGRKHEELCFRSEFLVTKHDLKELEDKIMSAISEFAQRQEVFNTRLDGAVAGLTEDVQTLTDKITKLQNTPGAITPEDQALLDAIQTRTEAITAKLEALDGLTPPKPPVS